VVVLFAAAVSACGGDGPSTEADVTLGRASRGSISTGSTGRVGDTAGTTQVPSPTTEVAPSTTAAPDGDEAAVLATVDCYWSTILAANDPPDPGHPGFAECFTGPALERSTTLTEAHRARGERVTDSTGLERFGTRVVDRLAGRLIVAECFIDDAVVIDAAGSTVDDSVTSFDAEIIVVRTEDGWRVSESVSLAEREGRSCDER
jgi:hypothetical protein